MSLSMKALLVMPISFQNIVLFVSTFFEFAWDGVFVIMKALLVMHVPFHNIVFLYHLSLNLNVMVLW